MTELSQSRQSYFFNNPEAKVQRRENLEQVRFPRYIPADDGSGSPLRDVHLAKQLGQCCSLSSLRSMAFRPDLLIEVVREAVRVTSPTLPPAASDLVTRYALQAMQAFPYPDHIKHELYVNETVRINKLRAKHNLLCLPEMNFRQFCSIGRSLEWYLGFVSRSNYATSAEAKASNRRTWLAAKLQRLPFQGLKGTGGCSGHLP